MICIHLSVFIGFKANILFSISFHQSTEQYIYSVLPIFSLIQRTIDHQWIFYNAYLFFNPNNYRLSENILFYLFFFNPKINRLSVSESTLPIVFHSMEQFINYYCFSFIFQVQHLL